MTQIEQVMQMLRRCPRLTSPAVVSALGVSRSNAATLLAMGKARLEAEASGPPAWRHPTPHVDAGRQAAITKAKALIATGDDPSAAVNYVRQIHPGVMIRVEDVTPPGASAPQGEQPPAARGEPCEPVSEDRPNGREGGLAT